MSPAAMQEQMDAACWPFPLDRRAMKGESNFGQLDEAIARDVRAQEAAIRREASQRRHAAIREAIQAASEAPL